MPHMDYDQVASSYNARFTASAMPGVSEALAKLAAELEAVSILEVGCGTGRWLADLLSPARRLYGLDLSAGMLAQARQHASLFLVRGQAEKLPYPSQRFDLIYCVNALHHFHRPRAFITEASRTLRAGGALAVIGMSPPASQESWYIYQYFEGTFDLDRARYPAWGALLDWMAAAGFQRAEWRPAEQIRATIKGRAVLDDYFLRREATSQLALLSPAVYAAGLQRIHRALEAAESAGRELPFPIDIDLYQMVAWTE